MAYKLCILSAFYQLLIELAELNSIIKKVMGRKLEVLAEKILNDIRRTYRDPTLDWLDFYSKFK